MRFAPLVLVLTCMTVAQASAACLGVDPRTATSFGGPNFHLKFHCTLSARNGYPVPDPACTPGAVNPTVTAAVLGSPGFRTSCLRDNATTEEEKAVTYLWYELLHPANNTGPT